MTDGFDDCKRRITFGKNVKEIRETLNLDIEACAENIAIPTNYSISLFY